MEKAKNVMSTDQAGTHKHRKTVANRLARAGGHLRATREMIDADRDCSEILTQLAAVRGAIDRAARLVLEDHMEHCLLGVDSGRDSRTAWQDFKQALDRYWGGAS